VRRIALDELERAGAARAALARGGDPEALHDFRVALRRLRSHLRAYETDLDGAVGRGVRRRLRKLAAATNPGRDAEVGATLALRLAEDGGIAERRAAGALAQRLETRRDEIYAHVDAELLARFDRLADRLREALSTWRVEVRLDGGGAIDELPRPFRAALGEVLGEHAAILLEALDRVRAEHRAEDAHRARIEAKRLRYLLEPLGARLPGAPDAVKLLKRLQDLLGDANDLVVLAGELAAEAARAEEKRLLRVTGARSRAPRLPGGRAGRQALARRIAERGERLRERFERDWLAEGAAEAAALTAAISSLVDALG